MRKALFDGINFALSYQAAVRLHRFLLRRILNPHADGK